MSSSADVTQPSGVGSLPSLSAPHQGAKPEWKLISDNVAEKAMTVFKFIAGAALFLINPGLFIAGFTCSVLIPDKMHHGIERIKAFWNDLYRWEKVVLVAAAHIAFPQVAACASFTWGAYLVTRMGQTAGGVPRG